MSYIPVEIEYIGFIGAHVKPKLSETLVFGVEEKSKGRFFLWHTIHYFEDFG